MRRFLLQLSLLAGVVVLIVSDRANSQSGGPESRAGAASGGGGFGTLQLKPQSSATASAPLPAGVVPTKTATTAAAPTTNAPPRPAVVNPFPLTPNLGDWLICAATYVGPDGAELARQVTLELRNRHRLPAFIYNRGDEERRRQNEEWEAMQKRYPGVPIRRRGYRIQDQYAVLVGSFKDFGEASAQLPKIKALPLPKLVLEGGKSAYDVAVYHEVDPNAKKLTVKKEDVNPFHNALVVRNPLLATSTNGQFNRPKWDPIWPSLNAGETHSLLDNPKRYTLLVKEYQGASVIQQRGSGNDKNTFFGSLGLGNSNKVGETLDAAAMQARELVKFLRHPRLGYAAFVLHTRSSSAVFVGSFDGPDDPELQRVQRQLSALKFSTDKGGADPVGLLPTPVPFEVPRF